MLSTSACRTLRPRCPNSTVSLWPLLATFSLSPSAKRQPHRPVKHERSHSSSSKPSGPADDGSSPPQSQSATTTTTASTRISRRRAAKAAQAVGSAPSPAAVSKGQDANQELMNIPSVPSTTHLHPTDVVVSAFFSLHRPISVTLPVPATSTSAAFGTIFAPRSISHKPDTVIDTLSSTIESLDSAASYPPNSEHHPIVVVSRPNVVTPSPFEESSSRQQSSPIDSPLKFPSHVMNSNYRPFTPPAAPEPSEDPLATAEPQQAQNTKKSYTTVLTIVETTDAASGEKSFSARTTPVVARDLSSGEAAEAEADEAAADEASMSGSGDINSHDIVAFEDPESVETQVEVGIPLDDGNGGLSTSYGERGGRRRRPAMHAISVKRLRKLKMKKHKYKKMRKRTRNERKRQDRL